MKRSYYMVGIIMLTFFVISFLTNVFGPLIPDMITGFSLSLTLVAILPFAFFIAYGVVSIPAGMLIEKYNEKTIMVAAFIVAFTGSLILAVFPNYLAAVGSLFIIGCGMAMLQVVINPLLRTSGGEEHYAFYSILAQLIFGLASFVSPLVYSNIVINLKQNNTGSLFSKLLSKVGPVESALDLHVLALRHHLPSDDRNYFLFPFSESGIENGRKARSISDLWPTI